MAHANFADPLSGQEKSEIYAELRQRWQSLYEADAGLISNTANLASMLFHSLPDLNWAGFYFLGEGLLRLGPFQGKPACLRISLEQGVCGKAATTKQTVVVPDVHQFPGHIACDEHSRSEIVIPFLLNGELIGVLDLDSPILSRFDDLDAVGLQRLLEVFEQSVQS